ncbi:MAG: phytoene desaturase [Spirochaetes bacterium]|nr:phytoene desaturase [Spirochaetota bacterium]
MQKKKVIVIGAGFGGLTTAALLARNGFNVTVIEKNSMPGGRAIVYKEKGFVFDMGPSWYLMPEAMERYFNLFDKSARDFYKLVRLDPSYRVFYGKKEQYDIKAGLKDNFNTFNLMQKDGAGKLKRYLDQAEYQYDIAVKKFLYRDYTSFFDFMDRDLIRDGLKLKIFYNVDKMADRFGLEDKLKKIIGYTMVFIGGSPKNTPALYSLMTHIDLNLGVWYPMGGMGEIPKALEKLGKALGVTYLYDHNVIKITVENRMAKNVITDKGTFPGDIILSNADYHHTETKLLEKRYRTYSDGYWKRKVISPSSFIIYMGLSKKLKNLVHHNLYFHNNWDEHFQTIFDKPQWPDKFSYYISCPSKTDPSVAPRGKENLFFLVPVAAGLVDTDEIREKVYEKVISHFEDLIGEKVSDSIIHRRIFSHRDFIGLYHSYKGSAFSLAHTLLQTALFRCARKSKKVKNLYFTGQYTHPGVGVPMNFITAELTAKSIIEDFS